MIIMVHGQLGVFMENEKFKQFLERRSECVYWTTCEAAHENETKTRCA